MEKKHANIQAMFDDIAPRYDFLNHFLSLNIDKIWRKKLVRMLKNNAPQSILDLAAGTCDLSIALARLHPQKIVAADLSSAMLAVGQKKITQKGLSPLITTQTACAEQLPFSDNTFDACTIGFGIRNFEDPQKGLDEILRVLKPNGRLLILEFSKSQGLFSPLFRFYFKNILPLLGKIISKNASAYTYLPDSVQEFPSGKDFLALMEKSGFKNTSARSLTLGIASIYSGEK